MNVVEWEEENMRNITDLYDYPASHSCVEDCKLCIHSDDDGMCIPKAMNWCFTCHGEKFEGKED